MSIPESDINDLNKFSTLVISDANLALEKAVANQQTMNELGIAITGKSVSAVSNISPMGTRPATGQAMENNATAETRENEGLSGNTR